MIGLAGIPARSLKATLLLSWLVLVIGCVLLATRFVQASLPMGLLGLAFVAAAAPAALLAWHRPFIFPGAVYAMLIPFDNLTELGSVSSLSRAVGALFGLALLIALVRKGRIMRPPRELIAWMLVIFWMITSAFWALNQSTAMGQLAPYLQLFGLFAIVALSPVTRDDFFALALGAIIGAVVAACVGIVLYSHGQDISHGRLVVQFGGRAIDENHNAASLLMPLMLAFVAAFRTRWPPGRIMLWLAVLTIVAGLVLTGSRGGFVAMLAGAAVLFVRTKYRFAMLTGMVGIGIAGASSVLISRFSDVVSSGGAGRSEIWASAWRAFQDHWLVGVGIGNFQEAYDAVYMDVYHPTYSHWHMVAHNIIAQTGVEIGLVGLLLVGVAWALMLCDPPASRDPSSLTEWWRAAQAGLVALLCASMFVDLAWYKDPWLGFMLAIVVKNVTALEHSFVNLEGNGAKLWERTS
jgi:O-antigen ligase